jgi:hypothetical protein
MRTVASSERPHLLHPRPAPSHQSLSRTHIPHAVRFTTFIFIDQSFKRRLVRIPKLPASFLISRQLIFISHSIGDPLFTGHGSTRGKGTLISTRGIYGLSWFQGIYSTQSIAIIPVRMVVEIRDAKQHSNSGWVCLAGAFQMCRERF